MEMNEAVEHSALRELEEETGLKCPSLCFLNYYDAIDRDPRGRTVSFVFFVLVEEEFSVKGASDAEKAEWTDIFNLPELSFDHEIENRKVEKPQGTQRKITAKSLFCHRLLLPTPDIYSRSKRYETKKPGDYL